MPSHSFSRTILLTGLLAGTCDILGAIAITYTKLSPLVLLQYVASGVIGNSAFTGGTSTALLGLGVHYCIAFTVSIIVFLTYPFAIKLLKNKYLAALAYGIVVWCVMNLIAVPLSQAKQGPFRWDNALLNMLVLVICIGLPTSLMAYQYYRRSKAII
ncbi:hypothetical protein [Chryseosolibacter indicus]|uniref:DUF1440 domain-containing protein n=1 Tax=Chryseosolibacter indicus TaxID=2782351 RepID=A0ABS5VS96_9BACT|nr:hypothetical protein [Chryseosolibacter indicus]MBT1704304.1 hypothetical protein [Chryseosolibacter indicus]